MTEYQTGGNDTMKLTVRRRFEPRDLWIGVFWDHTDWGTDIYLCLVPALPLHIRIEHKPTLGEQGGGKHARSRRMVFRLDEWDDHIADVLAEFTRLENERDADRQRIAELEAERDQLNETLKEAQDEAYQCQQMLDDQYCAETLRTERDAARRASAAWKRAAKRGYISWRLRRAARALLAKNPIVLP